MEPESDIFWEGMQQFLALLGLLLEKGRGRHFHGKSAAKQAFHLCEGEENMQIRVTFEEHLVLIFDPGLGTKKEVGCRAVGCCFLLDMIFLRPSKPKSTTESRKRILSVLLLAAE